MEWNFDNVKYNGKDLDRVQVDGVTVWEKKKVVYYEYCVNTASTRIDTGIAANNNTRLEFKLYSNRTDSFYALGTRQTSAGNHLFSLTGSNSSHNVNIAIGNTYSLVPDLVRISSGFTYSGWFQTNGDMTFSWYLKDEGTNTEYNKSNVSYSISLTDNTQHIYLFSNGFQNLPPTLRFYYVRIYQDGVLVRDFRPAKVNGVDGLYDEVSGNLYSTSNVAVGGNEIQYYDYLENDGKAYINTNYYPNQSTKLITKKRYSLNSTSILFGEMDKGLSAGRDAFFISKTQFGFDKLVFSVSAAPEGTEPYLLELSVDGLYRDGVLISKPKSDIATTWTSPREMYLFSINRGDTKTINNTALYYCRIYDNDVLVRDYKPCLYNGEAGLWDSVECKFYGNANNTGTLTVGNDE